MLKKDLKEVLDDPISPCSLLLAKRVQFIKDYIPELLGQYGIATSGIQLAVEVKEIDVLFIPNKPVPTDTLGLLGKLAQTACIFEVYRNSVSTQQTKSCLVKLFEVQTSQLKEAQKNQRNIPESDLIRLWILTPTLSQAILNSFGAYQKQQQGVYFLAESFKTAIVVIHQLPINQETLWLRILGKGTTQENAITELEALPAIHPYKENVLELIYKLLNILEVNRRSGQVIEQEDTALMRRIDALYEEKMEQVKQQLKQQLRQEILEEGVKQGLEEGVKQGEALLTLSLLKHILGELPPEIETTITNLDKSSIEALAKALLNFKTIEDLINWLSIHQ